MPGDHSTKKCTFDGCGKPLRAKGLCSSHYAQAKTGKPLMPLYSTRRRTGNAPKIDYTEVDCPVPTLNGPCHVCSLRLNDSGYSLISVNGQTMRTHRYAWELVNGPIPKGMVMDHLCRVRACCNPDHLRIVTQTVNVTENVVGSNWQLQAAKTHCFKGHLLDEKNTRVDKKGHRYCRTCHLERQRRYYHENSSR